MQNAECRKNRGKEFFHKFIYSRILSINCTYWTYMQKDKCDKSDLLIVSRAKISEPFGGVVLSHLGGSEILALQFIVLVMVGAVRAPHLHTTS